MYTVKLTQEQVYAIETRENVYIDIAHGVYNREGADAIYGWMPLPKEWSQYDL